MRARRERRKSPRSPSMGSIVGEGRDSSLVLADPGKGDPWVAPVGRRRVVGVAGETPGRLPCRGALMSYENLAGRTAVVTGAASGIGEAVAVLLAAQGARVALLARRRERLDGVVEKIRADGGQALAVV